MDTFEFIELEYNQNPVKNGEYIDLSSKLIPEKNTIFTFGSSPCGIYIVDFFDNVITLEIMKILMKSCKMHNGRGDYSGTIDKNKLYPSYHKYLDDPNVKFNKNKTRINKSDNCNYAFSNGCKYTVINENKPYYKDNKKVIHESMDNTIIKPINKIMHHFFDLPKNNNVFGFWNELIFNSNTRAAIHSDEKNKDNLSCLISLSTDETKLKYCNLNLVDYNISIPMKNNKSILIMNLKNIRHSNDPIQEDLLKYRHSIVLYNK